MKKTIMLCLFFLFFLTSLLFAETFSDVSQDVSQDTSAEQALSEFVDFLLKNLNKPYYLLSKEEEEKLAKAYRKILDHKKELYRVYKIPYSTLDWLTLKGVPSNPAVKVKPGKFTLIETSSYIGALVFKKIYGDAVDIMIYDFPSTRWASAKKIQEWCEKEKDRFFCFFCIITGDITCPPFHLEKDTFGKEMIDDCLRDKGSDCAPIPPHLWSYEKLRRMLIWIEKEFGPKGRNLIPGVEEVQKKNFGL